MLSINNNQSIIKKKGIFVIKALLYATKMPDNNDNIQITEKALIALIFHFVLFVSLVSFFVSLVLFVSLVT